MKKLRILFIILTVMLMCTLPALAAEGEARDVSFENTLAADLKALGLFSGVSDTDFDLERAPSRTEVLVMLIRVLGEEQAAKSGSYEIPFTDVPEWAAPYVGYAYENGLTQGISATEFGNGEANAATYLTFMLRALGYSDAEGDFSWSDPYPIAKDLGLLPSFVDVDNFWRADIVSISYAALSVDLKFQAVSLGEKLMQKGIFTSAVYGENYSGTKISDKENENKQKLTAEEIFANCSDSVFYIEVQTENGIPISSGSGFFITENGRAVTNWHVVNGADKIIVTLQNGETHEVTTIWDYNPELDYAIIDIGGDGYKPLEINPFPLKTGSDVYAIGSPKGLQNTITYGIVSNPARVVEGSRFIQTSAAISGGSSGGVLLNSYGEVIGITSNSYTDGQNLNFARPIANIACRKTEGGNAPSGTNWEYLRAEFEENEFALLPGETIAVEYTAYYYTSSGSFPSISIYTSDEDVAVAATGISKDVIYIYAKGEGTATLYISGASGHKDKITVTVGEGQVTEEHVGIITSLDALSMNVGAEKIIKAKSFLVNSDAENVKLTAYSKDTKIAKVEDNKNSDSILTNYGAVKMSARTDEFVIKGVREGTTEIVIRNDVTSEEVVIPVTVGDCYRISLESLVRYVYENGTYSPSENGALTYYSVSFATSVLNETASLLYYPTKKELHLQVVSHMQYTMYFDIVIGEAPVSILGREAFKFELLIPSLGIEYTGEIEIDGFGDGDDDGLFSSRYKGPDVYKEGIAAAVPRSIVNMLYVMDTIFADITPGVAVSDFGFLDVDYEEYGLVK